MGFYSYAFFLGPASCLLLSISVHHLTRHALNLKLSFTTLEFKQPPLPSPPPQKKKDYNMFKSYPVHTNLAYFFSELNNVSLAAVRSKLFRTSTYHNETQLLDLLMKQIFCKSNKRTRCKESSR